MMPARVLHVLLTARPEYTAVTRIVAALAGGLAPGRFEQHAWFLGGGGPLATELQSAGVRVRLVDWLNGVREPAGAWRFWHALRGEPFDIVHQHFGGRSLRWIAHRVAGARVLVQMHTRVVEARGRQPVSQAFPAADLVIADCRAIAEVAVGVRPRVVYLGVEVPPGDGAESPRPAGSSRLVVGTAGRLVPLKGIVYAVRAIAGLCGAFPGLRLEIAGSGPERARLADEARAWGIAERVTFLGWQPDLRALLPTWDVFLHPSLEEGFPVAVLEAMASGIPVVASAVGGVPELVEDGRTGWLVPPGDAGALGERLGQLLSDGSARRAMGAAARQRVRHNFTVDRMVDEIAAIYADLLEGRPASCARR